MQKRPIIQFTDFTFQYDAQSEPTLKKINLSIYPGEKILIIGASGSGKSTLAKCLNGLIPQIDKGTWEGQVTINEKPFGETSIYDFSLEVGTVLQDTDGQFVGLTVAEDMAFSLENDQVPQVEMKKAVAEWAEKVGVANLLTEKPQNLSGGQKQRVSIAGVVIDETPILLFDEPLASLDPKSGKESIALIDDLHQRTNLTTIIIEHRLEDVLYRSVDRIILMSDGEIVANQTPAEILRSNLLIDYGIREPLYISALKKAKVNLNEIDHIENLEKMTVSDLYGPLTQWQDDSQESIVKTDSPELISVNTITFTYPHSQKQLLKTVSFSINRGEMLSLVGANGTGKSTLSKIICGFYQPDSGQINWKGQTLLKESIKERGEKIGLIMQNPNQMISQNRIFDEVALGLVNRGVATEKIEEKVFETLKICGLYAYRNWPISALSYGQKKRVTIASILVLEPELLILDEPTAGQDYAHYTEMMKFLVKLNQQGQTIVMITHDMHLMQEYTDRTIVINEGQVLADATPAEVLTNEHLVEAASLKETSLFTLAKRVGLNEPLTFVDKFIQQERQGRVYE